MLSWSNRGAGQTLSSVVPGDRRSARSSCLCSARARTVAGAEEPESCKVGRVRRRLVDRREYGHNLSGFVGIDVSKAYLDVAVRPSGESWQTSNDAEGIALLVER